MQISGTHFSHFNSRSFNEQDKKNRNIFFDVALLASQLKRAVIFPFNLVFITDFGYVFAQWDNPFSTYAKFSEKLTFLTP